MGIINESPLGADTDISDTEFFKLREEHFPEKVRQLHTLDSIENFKFYEGTVRVADLGDFWSDLGFSDFAKNIRPFLKVLTELYFKKLDSKKRQINPQKPVIRNKYLLTG